MKTIDRQPAVAGQFYPDEQASLIKNVEMLFDEAKPQTIDNVRAIISPHAGYVYSGVVAASGFNQIDNNADFENVIVIASSHRVSFDGASIYSKGDYITPLGRVKVNKDLSQKLINEHNCFNSLPHAHSQEHSLEVQLPFLQYKLGEKLQIVPIVIGSQSPQASSEIAAALSPYFTPQNLFVISTDFSHYPNSVDAQKADKKTAEAIISNKPQQLIDTLSSFKKQNIPHLVTNLCGWTSVLSLMYITQNIENTIYKTIEYRNSGDALYGDKQRVVGYYSIAVSINEKI